VRSLQLTLLIGNSIPETSKAHIWFLLAVYLMLCNFPSYGFWEGNFTLEK
jgi:hypothetical protein